MRIPIKKYVDDPSLSWEERYMLLEAHHQEETTWMITEILRLEEALSNAQWEITEQIRH